MNGQEHTSDPSHNTDTSGEDSPHESNGDHHTPDGWVHIPYTWRYLIPSIFVACIVALPAVVVSRLGFFVLSFDWLGRSIDMPLLAFAPIFVLIKPYLSFLGGHRWMTPTGLYANMGVYQWERRDIDIPFEHIAGVSIEQNIIERILNFGTILIGTSATGDVEVSLHGVPNPKHYAQILDSGEEAHYEKYYYETQDSKGDGP